VPHVRDLVSGLSADIAPAWIESKCEPHSPAVQFHVRFGSPTTIEHTCLVPLLGGSCHALAPCVVSQLPAACWSRGGSEEVYARGRMLVQFWSGPSSLPPLRVDAQQPVSYTGATLETALDRRLIGRRSGALAGP
jgi:hypothetical protein